MSFESRSKTTPGGIQTVQHSAPDWKDRVQLYSLPPQTRTTCVYTIEDEYVKVRV